MSDQYLILRLAEQAIHLSEQTALNEQLISALAQANERVRQLTGRICQLELGKGVIDTQNASLRRHVARLEARFLQRPVAQQ